MVHFEFLTEDQSSAKAMVILIDKLFGDKITYNIHSYKGLGHTPKNLRPKTDAKKRILLDRLPGLLRGYGHNPNCGIIVILCDLDKRNEELFRAELQQVLDFCNPKPITLFCLAIEEFEAWYLGDLNAIYTAYPSANQSVLNSYKNDSICDTWEFLADAVCKGGSIALKEKGWQAIGKQKSIWAEEITPHMNINDNISPSFMYMCTQLRNVSGQTIQNIENTH
ncbi:MAG: DUF4276 family protein [Chitinispirillales bacterium]|jgi:hypothetical protein|nr:DUF4276 family protein [Chitinispirillales bacterium]